MEIPLFEFNQYRDFLKHRLTQAPKSRGQVSRLAEFLHCQSSFLSQVLSGRSHLSLEHAHSTTRFLELSPEEQDFFMLLVQENRAGSDSLRGFYRRQMKLITEKRQVIRERIQVKSELNDLDKITYYSSWWYAAIHILIALPRFQTPEEISRRLSLSKQNVSQALRFLKESGLAKERQGRFTIGSKRIHLDKSSPLVSKHHLNWRFRAAHSIENSLPDDLNYSAVISISESDARKLKALLLELIQKSETLVRDSPEEEAFGFLIDFFKLR